MNKKKTFDSSQLNDQDQEILIAFQKRRMHFNTFLYENKLENTTCPGCGFPSLSEDWFHEICSVCNWQNDGQDDPEANLVSGGPNYQLSLTENRLIIGRKLNELANENQSEINHNPLEVLQAFEKHNTRMIALEDKMMDVKSDDPLWEEWHKTRKEILKDLFKNK